MLIRYILAFPRSVYANMRLLPFRQAIRLPILISHKTRFRSLAGRMEIDKPEFASVKIGFGTTPVTDFSYDRTIINLKGTWKIRGRCKVGAGSKLHIRGLLETGDRFNMTGGSAIICHKQIRFGSHVLISWGVQIMDTDQHKITDMEGNRINEDAAVTVGSDVWICSRVNILKGIEIGNGVVIGAGSTVVSDHLKLHTLVAGNPARVVRENIKWE